MINLSKKKFPRVNRKLLLKKYKDQHLVLGGNVTMTNTTIKQHNYIANNAILYNVSLDDYSYVAMHTIIRNAKIGKFCSIGDNVRIGVAFHPIDRVSTHPSFYSKKELLGYFAQETTFEEYKETIIGNDVWIGLNVLIFGGVTIGDGAVIAGGAVITKDVAPYSIMGGIPAKVIKYRFDNEIISRLLSFKWWDKDLEWIRENYKKFNVLNDFLDLIK